MFELPEISWQIWQATPLALGKSDNLAVAGNSLHCRVVEDNQYRHPIDLNDPVISLCLSNPFVGVVRFQFIDSSEFPKMLQDLPWFTRHHVSSVFSCQVCSERTARSAAEMQRGQLWRQLPGGKTRPQRLHVTPKYGKPGSCWKVHHIILYDIIWYNMYSYFSLYHQYIIIYSIIIIYYHIIHMCTIYVPYTRTHTVDLNDLNSIRFDLSIWRWIRTGYSWITLIVFHIIAHTCIMMSIYVNHVSDWFMSSCSPAYFSSSVGGVGHYGSLLA